MVSGRYKTWTDKELSTLQEMIASGMLQKDIAVALNCTTHAVHHARKRHKFPARDRSIHWSEAENDTLLKYWKRGLFDAAIGKRMDRYEWIIGIKRRELDLIAHSKKMDWGPKKTAKLKKLWAEGHSLTLIGEAMGITRGSVIGKKNRLGLPNRIATKRKKSSYSTRTRPSKKWQDKLPESMPSDTLPSERITVLSLKDNTCRFPLGNPEDVDFGFCGREVAEDYVYCSAHCRICYITISEFQAKKQQKTIRPSYRI